MSYLHLDSVPYCLQLGVWTGPGLGLGRRDTNFNPILLAFLQIPPTLFLD